jgi:predicted phosphodiesterase
MKKEIPVSERILKLKGEFTVDEVAKQADLDSKSVQEIIDFLIDSGYVFAKTDHGYVRSKTSPDRDVFDASRLLNNKGLLHFGLISDTHLASKQERLATLERMYDKFKQEGVNVVFHAGDWTDGVGVYRGQEFEVKRYGQQDQIDYAIHNYPKREGIVTVGISGNHDLKAYEKGGVDPLMQIARARKDIKYMGQYHGKAKLDRQVNVELVHPLGNIAYALSYKAQRDINNRTPDDLPNILAYGHYHTSFYMRYRGLDFIQVPCFKDAGAFEHRLGLNPTIGGWIVDAKSNGETIYQMDPRLYTFGPDRR